jgi:hypothetical protein
MPTCLVTRNPKHIRFPRVTVELSRREAKWSARTTCYTPVNGWLPTRVSLANRHALAELLGKRDNDALRPADVR